MSKSLNSSDAATNERLRRDHQLTVVVASGGSALVRRWQDGGAVLESKSLLGGQTWTFGEYLMDMVFEITCLGGTLTYSDGEDTGTMLDALQAQQGGQVGPGTVAAAVAPYVVAQEWGNEAFRKTVLTLTACPMTITDALAYAGVELYDFPEGRIHLLGCVSTLAPTTHTAIASTLNSGVTGSLSLGSVTASSTTLATTMVDMAPATAWTSSTVIDVAAAAVTPVLAAGAAFDGTATAKKMFMNASIPTGTDIDADATVLWSGNITFSWAHLGDK